MPERWPWRIARRMMRRSTYSRPSFDGQDAVGDQERGRARVVGDDAHRDVVVLAGRRTSCRQLARRPRPAGAADRCRSSTLTPCTTAHALEPHAGVDGRARERRAARRLRRRSNCMKTRFQISIQRRSRRRGTAPAASPRTGSVAQVDSGSPSTARTGPVSPIAQKLSFSPSRGCGRRKPVSSSRRSRPRRRAELQLVVAAEDGDHSATASSSQTFVSELPRERDRVLLEVVAEGEVAEHLEERVVARR